MIINTLILLVSFQQCGKLNVENFSKFHFFEYIVMNSNELHFNQEWFVSKKAFMHAVLWY